MPGTIRCEEAGIPSVASRACPFSWHDSPDGSKDGELNERLASVDEALELIFNSESDVPFGFSDDDE